MTLCTDCGAEFPRHHSNCETLLSEEERTIRDLRRQLAVAQQHNIGQKLVLVRLTKAAGDLLAYGDADYCCDEVSGYLEAVREALNDARFYPRSPELVKAARDLLVWVREEWDGISSTYPEVFTNLRKALAPFPDPEPDLAQLQDYRDRLKQWYRTTKNPGAGSVQFRAHIREEQEWVETRIKDQEEH